MEEETIDDEEMQLLEMTERLAKNRGDANSQNAHPNPQSHGLDRLRPTDASESTLKRQCIEQPSNAHGPRQPSTYPQQQVQPTRPLLSNYQDNRPPPQSSHSDGQGSPSMVQQSGHPPSMRPPNPPSNLQQQHVQNQHQHKQQQSFSNPQQQQSLSSNQQQQPPSRPHQQQQQAQSQRSEPCNLHQNQAHQGQLQRQAQQTQPHENHANQRQQSYIQQQQQQQTPSYQQHQQQRPPINNFPGSSHSNSNPQRLDPHPSPDQHVHAPTHERRVFTNSSSSARQHHHAPEAGGGSSSRDRAQRDGDVATPGRGAAGCGSMLGPNHPLPDIAAFQAYQQLVSQILDRSDYESMGGKRMVKRSGWRKLALAFNVSFESRSEELERDEHGNVRYARFVQRAIMPDGRFADGWGACDFREKRFAKPNHDVPATAETRAKNRACADLFGIGESKR